MDWFRFYTETINDRKLRRLTPAQRWLWVTVLSMARTSPIPGRLLLSTNVPVTDHDLVDAAAITKKDVQSGIEAFIEQKMIHREGDVYVVTQWDKRQYVSDDSSERVKRFRERKRNIGETLHVTDRNVTETPPDTDTETEINKQQQHARAREDDASDDEPKQPPKTVVRLYEQYFGRLANPILAEKMELFIREDGMEIDLIEMAFRRCRELGNGFPYAQGILQQWRQKGIQTVNQAEEEQKNWEEAKNSGTRGSVSISVTRANQAPSSEYAHLRGGRWKPPEPKADG